jgi:DNA-binding response OmpR family regulator
VLVQPDRAASYAGVPLPLSARQFDLLYVLVSHAGRLITPVELAVHAWGEPLGSRESVRKSVTAIRLRLEGLGAPPEHLATIRSLGYRWDSVVASPPMDVRDIAS